MPLPGHFSVQIYSSEGLFGHACESARKLTA
jgi:hypothetical protein